VILSGPQEQALRAGLRELKSFDSNASAMLSYVLHEADRDSFDALNLYYTTFVSGGAQVDLWPGSNHTPVAFEDRARYVRMVLYTRLNESSAAMQAIRFGLRSVVPSTAPCWSSVRLFGGDGLSEFLPCPSGPFHVLRAEDLELLVVGAPEVDLALLKTHTTYKNTPADGSAPIIQWFWQVLEEYSPEDRARFLQFAWGRARLPANFTSQHQRMTINVVDLPAAWKAKFPAHVGGVAAGASEPTLEDAASLRLPKSQTCFFILDLPAFPSLAILRHKLTIALECLDINF
jgi:E3 ubiquitin-protein ligase HERC2